MKMKLTPTRNSILQINILLLLAGVLGAQAQTTYFKENNATAINSSASCPNSQPIRSIRPLRIGDNPRSATV